MYKLSRAIESVVPHSKDNFVGKCLFDPKNAEVSSAKEAPKILTPWKPVTRKIQERYLDNFSEENTFLGIFRRDIWKIFRRTKRSQKIIFNSIFPKYPEKAPSTPRKVSKSKFSAGKMATHASITLLKPSSGTKISSMVNILTSKYLVLMLNQKSFFDFIVSVFFDYLVSLSPLKLSLTPKNFRGDIIKVISNNSPFECLNYFQL